MRQILSSDNWELKGFWPSEPLWTTSVESTVTRRGIIPWIPVLVPGGVHLALQKAGILPDPYFERNSLLCEWVEHRWWCYRTFFTPPPAMEGRRVKLDFKGLDDHAHIYLNGTLLGEHEGMFEPAVFDVTQQLHYQKENSLLVIFECPPGEQGQIGYTSKTFTQKARFNYKWDFCTRLVNIGIWQDVHLHASGSACFDDVFVSGDHKEGKGIIRVRASALGMADALKVEVSFHGEPVLTKTLSSSGPIDPLFDESITVENPRVWWPWGLGDQPLYDIKLTLLYKEEIVDSWDGRTGLRNLAFRRCDGAEEDALPYVPIVNGVDVYIKGVNLTPLDMCYGDISQERYERLFAMLRHMHVNLVRIWGGGIIETETFYRLADESGILIWQEFIQSSSGIDNMPSRDEKYLALLMKNAKSSVAEKRNHVSLAIWSGGNELMGRSGRPVDVNDTNIHMLWQLCSQLDPERLFLPSSPSGPVFGLLDGGPGDHHDVHGNWQYDGIRTHYEKYNQSDSMLQSEFGADGLCSLRSMKTFLSEQNLQITSMRDNLTWRHHGEWWDTLLYRDRPLFGEPPHMDAWIMASQLMQAEAIRYIVQANRRRKFQNCGSIIWQFNEPYPNASCTSLTEYAGYPKHAYYAVRKAYSPLDVSLKYSSLLAPADEPLTVEMYAHATQASGPASIHYEALDVYGKHLARERITVELLANRCIYAGARTLVLPSQPYRLFFIRLTLEVSHVPCAQQLYFFTQASEQNTPLQAMLHLPKASMRITRTEKEFLAENIGETVCLFLHAEPVVASTAMLKDSFVTLFPGESLPLVPLSYAPEWRFTALNDME